ncbi:MAG: rhodanese-like domain-containing protein [Terracidiphilus sp.]|jgi:rhodanese-related sulfurtransferase
MPETLERVIDIETWKEWQAAGSRAQLVDVRSATEFATAHLPGAINIPLEQIELRTADLEVNTPVVLVCQGGTRARLASALLANSGRDLVVLEGGTGAWLRAGNPAVRSTASRWALERQVRLIAGLLVVTGVLLAVVTSHWWLIVPAFVGSGLVFAGCSGLCPLGEMLARLPWNRPRTCARVTAPKTPAGVSCACKFESRP